jgi:hypothetical protein
VIGESVIGRTGRYRIYWVINGSCAAWIGVPDETSFSPIETSMRLLAFYVLSPSSQGI